MTESKILIFNYAFPPNPGVGGRRWAKFCKYLNNLGEDFIVVCKKPNSDVLRSNWSKDVTEFKDKIIYFDFGYPAVLEANEFGLLDKLRYRVALKQVKMFSKGNYYDRSCVSEQRTKRFIREQLKKEKITSVVVTVAPFGFARIIGDLKQEFQHIKFIVDFRDPWIDNETSYGFKSMSKDRQLFEIQSEKEVIENYDAVVSVSEVMSINFKKRYPDVIESKFFTIANGFDYDDVSKKEFIRVKDKIKLVFIGTFYEKAFHHIEILKSQLKEMKEKNVELYNRISIDFYGSKPFEIMEFTDVIDFHDSVSTDKVSGILNEADVGLLFLTDDINYSFSTKFCEYIANKLPIIVFSKRGKTGEYIEGNRIGVEINDQSEKSKLLDMLNSLSKFKLSLNNFDTSNFDIAHLSERYLKIIKSEENVLL